MQETIGIIVANKVEEIIAKASTKKVIASQIKKISSWQNENETLRESKCKFHAEKKVKWKWKKFDL